jgi:hypothetical protein
MPAGSHISDVGVCKDWGTVKKGDVLSVKGYFDGDSHMQMSLPGHPGKLEAQMGSKCTRFYEIRKYLLIEIDSNVDFCWVDELVV